MQGSQDLDTRIEELKLEVDEIKDILKTLTRVYLQDQEKYKGKNVK